MNRCSFPREPVSTCGIELLTAWQVWAGSRYRIRAERSREDSSARIRQAGRELVALRTMQGEGCLNFNGKDHTLPGGSLVVFKYPDLKAYATTRAQWKFWWFEFRPTEPFPLPLGKVMNMRGDPGEEEICLQIFRDLRSETLAFRCRAAALVQSLLFGWWGAFEPHEEDDGHTRLKVQKVIEEMHVNPEKPWTLRQMAACAGMCESSLRAAFHQTIGKSPAQVRNQLRLSHAYEILRRGDTSVSEVAERLGYCDAFHFSKVFKKEYGSPPARFRNARRDSVR